MEGEVPQEGQEIDGERRSEPNQGMYRLRQEKG